MLTIAPESTSNLNVIAQLLLSVTTMVQQFVAPQAQTELVAEYSSIRPGQTFKVALHMKMDPEWHSYYMNPGESGQATSIKWSLPRGFVAGPIKWPAPIRKVIGGVAGYVYENEAWLVTDIQAPSNLTLNTEYTLGAEAKWLLCREACVPQKSKRKVTVRTDTNPVKNDAFDPAKISEPSWKPISNLRASLMAPKKIVNLTVDGIQNASFFPADPDFFGADLPQIHRSKSRIEFQISLSKYAAGLPKRLVGVLNISSGPLKGAHWVDVQLGNL